ncbi:metallophosphoesterase [Nitrosomonas sp. Nm33]|uniref:metallophosphoesterase family protein n=1 Tax=Nitrosomonas sp. Nm33 TaxID=133724 RepID=UPI0008948AA7|nr:metallophosphoesterase family protein [Nitrosomonas sp. Nm33]SDY39352.1 phosphoesterase, MJ0936 family [Nitrosomonas sp. Nm33]
MRIAVVSDIHGNLPALEAVVAHFKQSGVDAVVNLGDNLSGPLLPLETAQYLMAQDWIHISGNHDRQLLAYGTEQCTDVDELAYSQLTPKELAWLKSLPHKADFGEDILLCHGTPASDSTYFLETVEAQGARMATRKEVDERLGTTLAKLVLCGHTHKPRAIRASSGQLVVNPGSVGLPAYDDATPYFHVIETGSPDAHYAIVERIKDQWIASLITVPYDHDSMVKLADSRRYYDWAQALATGYMF